MENLAPAEPQARARLTDDQAQDLVLRTVATQAESLLRTAYRHSLCADDAHDAYQRSMEIFLRRAPTLDPTAVHKWLHVVVKHEAMEVRRGRVDAVASEDIDFERHESPHVSSPEERALTIDRTTRAAEALRRLKPQELRAMWLKAMGHSYAEIGAITGYSPTKVNRCLAEGRKSFLERFEGIEAGVECERWQPVLSAMADGEATAAQITEARPHLRNCPACRATLRGLDRASRPLAAVLPVGLVGAAGAKLGGLVERLMPAMAGGGDAGAAVAVGGGGAGVLGLGGMKLAGLVAAGAAATAGGGLVVKHEAHRPAVAAAKRAAPATVAAPSPSGASLRSTPASAQRTAATAGAGGGVTRSAGPRIKRRLVARRKTDGGRLEFTPVGGEPAAAGATAPAPAPARLAAVARPDTAHSTPSPVPPPAPASSSADTSRGEFAPQP
ncbi:MAG TPA: sigma-70 family RNA polymerase sigma factor [Baekduia sp.]|nr:sigma-70 family RNA polymerase sigma factor [Baekduia sp.]